MAVKTTKIQCNQDVDLRGKVDVEGKVTCGNDVDVDGKLIINSAKDLVTKDGTSFGGNDIFAIENNRLVENDEGKYIATLTNEEVDKILHAKFVYWKGENSDIILSRFGDYFLVNQVNATAEVFGALGYVLSIYDVSVTKQIEISVFQSEFSLSDYATKTDLKTKQSTLYRHTVTFAESGLGYTNRFTAYSEKNTPIDSIQDLITVFGNTELMCTGTIESGSNPCVGINVGTTADTILFLGLAGATQKLSSWYSTSPEATLTITDNVTAM